jgi:hypothetical protein
MAMLSRTGQHRRSIDLSRSTYLLDEKVRYHLPRMQRWLSPH